jgi:hypothetical protein
VAVDSVSPLGRASRITGDSGALVGAADPQLSALPSAREPPLRRYAQASPSGGEFRVAPADPDPAEVDPDDANAPFVAAAIMPKLADILNRVVPPLGSTRLEEVAVASINGLAALDPELWVERDGRFLFLMRGRQELGSVQAPYNLGQWANAAEQAAKLFRSASPTFAEARDNQLADAFYRGLAEPLGATARFRASTESPDAVETASDGQVEQDIVNGVGVLRVSNVSVMSAFAARRVLEGWGLLGDGPRQVSAVILDLTDAMGHETNAATMFADDLLRRGVVFRSRANNPHDNMRFEATSGGIPDDVRIVVMTNGRTRGAAEVLAQALQENQRAVVYGTSTLGESRSYRNVLTPGGGHLLLADAEVFGPANVSSQGQGVTPQVCAVKGGPDLSAAQRSAARRLGQGNERPTIPLRLFCPPSPSRAVVTGTNPPVFDNGDREAWTRNAIALSQDPTRYQAMLERVELAPQPATVRARNTLPDIPWWAGPK